MSNSLFDPPDSDPIPAPEPDASCRPITSRPQLGEYGFDAVGRQIAEHLSRLLNAPVIDLVARENPWDRRDCPRASFWEMGCAGHRIRITSYDTRHPLRRGSYTAHAITLDNQPVEFQRLFNDSIAWQLAEAIWSAHLDLPAHPHPTQPGHDETGGPS
jgi:hypothetical protein